jgi:hypothetical protein
LVQAKSAVADIALPAQSKTLLAYEGEGLSVAHFAANLSP